MFEAIETDTNGTPKGSPVVLKDIWIDHDRTREGDILALLHAEADDEDKRLVEKHFLTAICHGDVWTELNVLDDTENALMRGLKVTTDRQFKLQRKHLVIPKHEPASGSEGLRAISRLQAPHSHLKYAHKTHYRIVFKEKGITIDLIKSLPDVMTVLIETVNGAFLYDTVYLSALILSLCSLTTVAKVRMGTPRCEYRQYIIVRRGCQTGRSGICEEKRRCEES